MSLSQELDAIQRWVWGAAQLASYRLTEAPAQLARPVIVWEAPSRAKARNLGRWQYTNKVTQFGTLYVASVNQLIQYQDALETDLNEEYRDRHKLINQLPIYDQAGPTGVILGQLREVQLHFENAKGLDIPIRVEYEATYKRNRTVYPAATKVVTKVVMPGMP
ncbi:hypothetical protein [Paenibacillus agilis]|uniref:Uncharacterized protein n=1 Tax=Paenibacillus agilis TaxID=3020863 RepID=A0A559IX59_9BACL|nr:hypothetical protein [Paenibacillus agilis]TVX92220.1 hypothetical protein FPZ44_03595 [Paenibacillus agilis]